MLAFPLLALLMDDHIVRIAALMFQTSEMLFPKQAKGKARERPSVRQLFTVSQASE